MRVMQITCRDELFMNKPESLASPLSLQAAGDNDFSDEPLLTAKRASKALNLPLYYFTKTAKRKALGLPFYCVNRLVRFRLGELHQWQIAYAHKLQEEQVAPLDVGGANA
jgi:hypothetical protein